MNSGSRIHLPPIQDMLYSRPISFEENRHHQKKVDHYAQLPISPVSPVSSTSSSGSQRRSRESLSPPYHNNKRLMMYSDWEQQHYSQHQYYRQSADDHHHNKQREDYNEEEKFFPLHSTTHNNHGRSYSDQILPRRSSAASAPRQREKDSPRLLMLHRRTASDLINLKRSLPSEEEYRTYSPPPLNINNANANRYKCNQCLKTFSRPSSLRIHILSHTGEKPHVCPQQGCGRRFSVQSNMRRHLKVHYCNPQQANTSNNSGNFVGRLE